MISFSTSKLRKNSCFVGIRNVFPFSTVQVEKISWKKMVKKIGESIWWIRRIHIINSWHRNHQNICSFRKKKLVSFFLLDRNFGQIHSVWISVKLIELSPNRSMLYKTRLKNYFTESLRKYYEYFGG